ncbi:MAG: ComF family protein [Solirubrobacterales bacterium]
MLSRLVDLMVPPRCRLCAAECRSGAQLCARCESGLSRIEPRAWPIPGLDLVWSAARYEGVARRLVIVLKFGPRPALARRAAAAIAERAPAELLSGVIVPVPAAPWRRRRRGFDPAESIAMALAAQTGIELRRCLRRSQGRRQVGRPRAERLADPPRVKVAGRAPHRALLVDDVVTTGATLGACAEALRAAGTGRVDGVSFARSGLPWPSRRTTKKGLRNDPTGVP